MSAEKESWLMEDFEQRKDGVVKIHFSETDIRNGRLVEIKPLPQNESHTRPPFSLLFSTDLKEYYYPQGSFKLVFSDSEETLVFMVSIGVDPESGGVMYEAIFN